MNKLKEIYKLVNNFKINKNYFNYTNLSSEDYDYKRGKPAHYIKLAIEIAKLLDLKTVVEVGSIRHAVTEGCLDYFYNSKIKSSIFIGDQITDQQCANSLDLDFAFPDDLDLISKVRKVI